MSEEKQGVKKLNIGSMLVGAKAAEEALKRAEVDKLRKSLPEGHPLRVQAETIGDGLAELPPGHPLLQAMEAARQRYEEAAAKADEKRAADAASPEKQQELKKAKKLEQEERKDRISKEIATEEECRNAASAVNEGISNIMTAIKPLYGVLAENDRVFATNHYCQMRALKLKRMLAAAERAIFDCRMARV